LSGRLPRPSDCDEGMAPDGLSAKAPCGTDGWTVYRRSLPTSRWPSRPRELVVKGLRQGRASFRLAGIRWCVIPPRVLDHADGRSGYQQPFRPRRLPARLLAQHHLIGAEDAFSAGSLPHSDCDAVAYRGPTCALAFAFRLDYIQGYATQVADRPPPNLRAFPFRRKFRNMVGIGRSPR